MMNLRKDVPIKSELVDEVQHRLAQIRDIGLEIEQMLKMAIDDEVFMTRDEVSKMIRCDPKKIPHGIPRSRVGSQWLFNRRDVLGYIEAKKR